MRIIEISVSGVEIDVNVNQPLIAGSVDDVGCTFRFSEDWDPLTKVAVFTAGGESRSVILDGSTAAIPWETLQKANVAYMIGVYGLDSGRLVRQTTPCLVGYVRAGSEMDAQSAAAPSPTFAQQLLETAAAANRAAAEAVDRASILLSDGDGTRVLTDDGTYRHMSGDGALIPDSLPNPHPVRFTGAVTAEYDGSKPVDINIPSGSESAPENAMAVADSLEKASGDAVYITGEEPDGNLADILKDYQRKGSTMRIVYIKLDDGDATAGESWSSDAACIITGNANIMVDFGRIQDYDRIKAALLENGVTRLDYIFLSHYHHDHCGCMNGNKAGSAEAAEAAGTSLTTLWADEDIDTSNCVIVLPADVPASWIPEGEPVWIKRLILNLAAENNVVTSKPTYEGGYWSVDSAVPGEAPVWSQTKPKGGVIIRAHNCTDDFVAQYVAHNDYNETSTVLEAELGYTLATFTGDSSHQAQAALTDRLRQTDILKLGHHQTDADWHQQFYEKLNPRYVVASVDQDIYDRYLANLIPADPSCARPAIKWIAGQKIPFYPLSMSETCVFESDGRKIELSSNNRNHQPKVQNGTLLAVFPNGVSVNGSVNLADTGWDNFNVFLAQVVSSSGANIATGIILARISTTSGTTLRGAGFTGATNGMDSFFVTLSSSGTSESFTLSHCGRLVHSTASGYHTNYVNTNKLVAIYGLC